MEHIGLDFNHLCATLYDPEQLGVVVLKGILDKNCIEGIQSEIDGNRRNFVARPYRYGTTVQGLSSWDFERAVMDNYTSLKQLNACYDSLSRGLQQDMRTSLHYNEVKVNASHYPAGSVGIGPHKDNSFSVNFVAIFIVSGCNDFFAARDKTLAMETAFPVSPGDCVLMRGPRSLEERNLRPTHYVKQIIEDRNIVTFREINRGLAIRTHNIYNL
jgi:alkylated DNA repair dioxygenase AlkB